MGPGIMIQFKAGGRFFMGLNVVSLSGGGCSVKISNTLAASLRPDQLLSRVLIQHPSIPRLPLLGKISWIRGKQLELGDDSVLMGIEFSEADEAFTNAVDAYVLELLKASQ